MTNIEFKSMIPKYESIGLYMTGCRFQLKKSSTYMRKHFCLYMKSFTSIWKQLPLYESIDLHFIATTYIGNQRPIFRGIQGGGRAPRPPLRVPPLRGWGGASMGEALLILHLLASVSYTHLTLPTILRV